MNYKDICSLCKKYKEIEINTICKDCCKDIRSAFSYYIDGKEVNYKEYKQHKSL